MKPKRALIVFFLLLAAVLFSLGKVALARTEEQTGDIQQEMTPEEFKAAGLEKLTPAELAKLNDWLKGYREKAVKVAEKKAGEREKREKLELIVSRYNGVWTGVTPGEIIELEDGSKWRLANKDEHYGGHADHPAIAVYKAGLFGWKMRVSRIAEFYVNPVK
jgi:hypothetical protein